MKFLCLWKNFKPKNYMRRQTFNLKTQFDLSMIPSYIFKRPPTICSTIPHDTSHTIFFRTTKSVQDKMIHHLLLFFVYDKKICSHIRKITRIRRVWPRRQIPCFGCEGILNLRSPTWKSQTQITGPPRKVLTIIFTFTFTSLLYILKIFFLSLYILF